MGTPRDREKKMFQNEAIAQEHAEQVRREALRNGATEWRATHEAAAAKKAKLKELNLWAAKNVGLD